MGLRITGITYEELGGRERGTTQDFNGISKRTQGPRKIKSSIEMGESTYEELYEFSQQVGADSAITALLEEQNKYDFDKNPNVVVNNKYATEKDFIKVDPLRGKIEIVARAGLGDSFLTIFDALQSNARVASGRVRDSLWVVKNRTNVIARNRVDLENWIKNAPEVKGRDTYSFVFTAPYAYRLELDGISAGRHEPKTRDSKKKVPKGTKKDVVRRANGAVFVSMRKVKSLLKGNVFVSQSILTGGELGLTSPAKGSGVGRIRQRGKNSGMPYVYPCLNIFIPVDDALVQ
jgi:hypothetical protein